MLKLVMILKRVKKIKIRLTSNQIQKVEKTLGICRFLYNKFIEINSKYYNETKKFIFGYDFDRYVNNELYKEFPWIMECSAKARKDAIMNADKALKSFFQKKSGYLNFKSKKSLCQSYFFVKNGIRMTDESHVWIPILHEIKLCEKGYLLEEDIPKISSGRIVKDHNEFFVMFIIEYPEGFRKELDKEYSDGMGIDLGVKDYVTIFTNGEYLHIPNVNKFSKKIVDAECKIKMLQAIISRKQSINLKKYGYKIGEKIKKGEATKIYSTRSIMKLKKRIDKLKQQTHRIRVEFVRKLCLSLVITKPRYITIEDLSISNMLQVSGHKLADKIQKSLLYYFRQHLTSLCEDFDVELRIANRFFASSKTCCICGSKNKELSLADRVFKCNACGNKIDRDENASNNLYHLKKYKFA